MIQQDITPVPTHCTRKSTIWKRTLRLRTKTNIFRRIGREISTIDPEAEEGVGTGGGVIDENLGNVDVAD